MFIVNALKNQPTVRKLCSKKEDLNTSGGHRFYAMQLNA